ncbi:FAD-dependent oxidoreductase [Alphaproteobacteria bacterium]|nr:FAD-dependent oxidoreductase [Alphaproteobacteria bacterium]
MIKYDLIIIGAGMAGLPCAIHAADKNLSVLLIEESKNIGGKLIRSSGQISAAGTTLQKKLNITDSADDHLKEAWKICNETANLSLLRLAIDNAADTVEWLIDIGVKFPKEHPVISYNHDTYSTRRYQWPINYGKSILDAFLPLIDKHIDNKKIIILTECKALDIKLDIKSSKVITIQNNKRKIFHSKFIALTGGGYTDNQKLFKKYSPESTLYTSKSSISKGSVIKIAEKIGCKISGGDLYKGMLGGVLENPDDNFSILSLINTIPQSRMPWEIWVNNEGNRFMREDHPSATYREHKVNEQRFLKFFIIFDEGIKQNAPSIFNINHVPSTKTISSYDFLINKENTVKKLAKKIGVDSNNLTKSINVYNDSVDLKRDEYGREHFPRKILHPPYYAIMSVAYAMPSPAGICIDQNLRVLNNYNVPIKNLYAAGEIIGNTKIMGNCYISGMGVGPTITFGRLLAKQLY